MEGVVGGRRSLRWSTGEEVEKDGSRSQGDEDT